MSNQITTINGYDLFEVVSAFQKEIRRGSEENAMYWGVELWESGFIPYAWKRMIIISTEDVGLANPYAPMIINSLYWQYEKLTGTKGDKKKQNRLPYVQAILFLANAPKSRHTDWALNYHFDNHHFVDFKKKEIPDYALDIHTRRGKKMGKTIGDFFDVGSYVNNHSPREKEEFYKDMCRRRWTSVEWCNKAKEHDKEMEKLKMAKYKTYQPESEEDEEIPKQGELF